MNSKSKSGKLVFRTNVENKAVIRCPKCGAERIIVPAKIPRIEKGLKVRCKCGEYFKCRIEFRKQFRKEVRLKGEYILVVGEKRGEMIVVDISQNGLAFENMTPHPLKPGDIMNVTFNLDDPRRSQISKRAEVRSVKGNQIGVLFEETQWFDKDLGFYLRS